MNRALQAKLDSLPASPGVYVFQDGAGRCLYVGKASNLRNRVRSYFQSTGGDGRYFVARLPGEIGDLESYVTATEKEAALLENSLIKEQQPRYNFKLRDDKDFLSLRLDGKDDWPRLEVVRRPRRDGARYFGPYHAASAARSVLKLVNRFFRLRTCTSREFASRTRPCLQYQIKRCPGPCVMEADREAYADQVRMVSLFLEGRHDELVRHLGSQMRRASRARQYERAAVYRDQIRAVDATLQKQRVSLVLDYDQDVFGFFRQSDQVEFAVLMARRGRVVGVRTFAQSEALLPDDELLGSFLGEYYRRGSYLPDEILLPEPVEAMRGLADLFSERRGKKIRLVRPQRGNKADLVRMAMDNAAHAFSEKARARKTIEERLKVLERRLLLPRIPGRIECVDISHSSGQDTVAAVISLRDGEPDRKRYRGFHLRSAKGGDDYGAMSEVLTRRFVRAKERSAGWELPDLLVVDGGKGQLAIALRVLRELGVEGVSLAALAKEKERPSGEKTVDRIYLPGRKNAIPVRANDHVFSVLALARDEAHRVCNNLRSKLARRRKLRSALDDIEGVGPGTRAALLRHFGSMSAVGQAGFEQLLQAGANRRQAKAILAALQDRPEDSLPADAGAAEQSAVDNAFTA